jgi:hypothetical protein
MAARVPQHVRMDLQTDLGRLTSALYKASKACCGEWRTAF